MILIISEEDEETTDSVINWIHFLGGNFRRINGNTLVEESFSLELNNENIDFLSNSTSDIGSIWYRRGLDGGDEEKKFNFLNHIESFGINNILNGEKDMLINNSCYSIEKKWLSHPNIITRVKKIEVLNSARKIGIDVPNSLITNSKKAVLNFFDKNKGGIIVKSIYEASHFKIEDETYLQFTNLVTKEMIDEMGDNVFPALYQENLMKDYEIRSFYLNEKIYSMAIFSQNDEKTKIDFREYNNENPNRNVPFNLPKEVEQKLTRLMNLLQLKTGSIDIVKTVDNRYVFLEVNPIGQFLGLSYACNYALDYEVANYLLCQSKIKE